MEIKTWVGAKGKRGKEERGGGIHSRVCTERDAWEKRQW